MGDFYAPAAEGGLRYDDPGLGLVWPLDVSAISSRDREWHLLALIEADLRRRMQRDLSRASVSR